MFLRQKDIEQQVLGHVHKYNEILLQSGSKYFRAREETNLFLFCYQVGAAKAKNEKGRLFY